MKKKLIDVAEVIRSKNSGPYEITFDIIFRNWEDFNQACEKDAINPSFIARLYHIPVEKVINVIRFKPAKAFKATIVRPLCSGNLGETDVYGAQQHAPLLQAEIEL